MDSSARSNVDMGLEDKDWGYWATTSPKEGDGDIIIVEERQRSLLPSHDDRGGEVLVALDLDSTWDFSSVTEKHSAAKQQELQEKQHFGQIA